MKILALDPGDVWTGTALSDPLQMLARPHKTAETKKLIAFIADLLKSERISEAIIGYPKTMKGTQSQQTIKVEQLSQQLKETFPEVQWILWDERLSSKQADQLQRARTKEEKIKSHSVAAAFILDTYLTYKQMQKMIHDS